LTKTISINKEFSRKKEFSRTNILTVFFDIDKFYKLDEELFFQIMQFKVLE